MCVWREMDVQVEKTIVGQVEGSKVVLQTVRQQLEPPPGAVYFPVTTTASAHGGTNSQNTPTQQQQKEQFQEDLIRGELQQYIPARENERQKYIGVCHTLMYSVALRKQESPWLGYRVKGTNICFHLKGLQRHC